jgi:hypothetical protein
VGKKNRNHLNTFENRVGLVIEASVSEIYANFLKTFEMVITAICEVIF